MASRTQFGFTIEGIGDDAWVVYTLEGVPRSGIIRRVRATIDSEVDSGADDGTGGADDLALQVREAEDAEGIGGDNGGGLVLEYSLTPADEDETIDSLEEIGYEASAPAGVNRGDGRLYIAVKVGPAGSVSTDDAVCVGRIEIETQEQPVPKVSDYGVDPKRTIPPAPATSSSGGGSSSKTAFPATTGEAVGQGAPLRWGRTAAGENNARVYAAQGDADDYEVIGTALDAVASGASVDVATSGAAVVRFAAAPPATDNGKAVYLDQSAPGRGTVTPPSGSGALVLLGYLFDADGATTSPGIVLAQRLVYLIP